MSRISSGLPGAVVQTSNELYVKDGRTVRGVDITLPPDVFEEYKAGYRCLSCHAAQESAWPEECCEPYCRFKMKAEQPRLIEMEFQGEKDLWPNREPLESDIWTP